MPGNPPFFLFPFFSFSTNSFSYEMFSFFLSFFLSFFSFLYFPFLIISFFFLLIFFSFSPFLFFFSPFLDHHGELHQGRKLPPPFLMQFVWPSYFFSLFLFMTSYPTWLNVSHGIMPPMWLIVSHSFLCRPHGSFKVSFS